MLHCSLAFVVCSSCIFYLHLVGIHPISLRLLLYVQYTCTNFYIYQILQGVRQGGNSLPVLFGMYIDDLLLEIIPIQSWVSPVWYLCKCISLCGLYNSTSPLAFLRSGSFRFVRNLELHTRWDSIPITPNAFVIIRAILTCSMIVNSYSVGKTIYFQCLLFILVTYWLVTYKMIKIEKSCFVKHANGTVYQFRFCSPHF